MIGEDTRLGVLFPGQGSQFVGMGRDLAAAFPEARRTFAEADDVLGFSLSALCWNGPETELTRTDNAQPAILVHSIAVWRVLSPRLPVATLGAGHSLGEFSAYTAAGSLSFADALRVVRRRGELMFESGNDRPGAMAAVLGLDDAVVEAICASVSGQDEGVVVPANFNAPGQIVISGDVLAVERATSALRAADAKRVIPLNVSGAFHSPLMAVAAAGLREQLDAADLRNPAFPIVSNVTGEAISDAAQGRALLLEQLTSAVRWTDSMRTMRAAGISRFHEIGPGNVLVGLLRRIDREASGRAFGTAADLDQLSEEG